MSNRSAAFEREPSLSGSNTTAAARKRTAAIVAESKGRHIGRPTAFLMASSSFDARYPKPIPTCGNSTGNVICIPGSQLSKLRALAASPDPATRDNMDGLIRIAGRTLAIQDVNGTRPLASGPNVVINPDTRQVSFDGKSASFRRPDLSTQPALVLDYGPGVKGRHHVKQQVERLVGGRHPGLMYFALSQGPFINEFLLEYARQQLGTTLDASTATGTFNALISNQLLLGREDGMAAATTEMLAGQRQHGASTQIADLVIASGVHRAAPDELETGIANAYHLLKAGGLLLIRAPKDVRDKNRTRYRQRRSSTWHIGPVSDQHVAPPTMCTLKATLAARSYGLGDHWYSHYR